MDPHSVTYCILAKGRSIEVSMPPTSDFIRIAHRVFSFSSLKLLVTAEKRRLGLPQ